jgi:hypothetical protein
MLVITDKIIIQAPELPLLSKVISIKKPKYKYGKQAYKDKVCVFG